MARLKCIQILSYKYSGSTALQSLLAALPGVNTASFTEHVNNETLFWSKAASILGLHQQAMYNSQTPLAKGPALVSFNRFVTANLAIHARSSYTRKDFFDLWAHLCRANNPIFLEKSPQHLFQPAVVGLIHECIAHLEDAIDFLLIGLIRNPNAMLYSDFKRRGTDPVVNQHVWRTSYENLMELGCRSAAPLCVVKYESLVTDLSTIARVVAFTGHGLEDLPSEFLHSRSLDRWRFDDTYKFEPTTSVKAVAAQFGYADADLNRD